MPVLSNEQISNVTLDVFPTLKRVVSDMLKNYLETQGYGDFYDAFKVLYSSKHEDIIQELLIKMEKMNEHNMISHKRCVECGTKLTQNEECPNLHCIFGVVAI